ncbi:MAG TPA: hypothetical protein ENJ32_09720 [Crenotrichaceae bacterium]|nr:hypothetical protein [Crenotrichaceae bacterium]
MEETLETTAKSHNDFVESAQKLLDLCDKKPELPESGVSDQLLNRILSSKQVNAKLQKQNV